MGKLLRNSIPNTQRLFVEENIVYNLEKVPLKKRNYFGINFPPMWQHHTVIITNLSLPHTWKLEAIFKALPPQVLLPSFRVHRKKEEGFAKSEVKKESVHWVSRGSGGRAAIFLTCPKEAAYASGQERGESLLTTPHCPQ